MKISNHAADRYIERAVHPRRRRREYKRRKYREIKNLIKIRIKNGFQYNGNIRHEDIIFVVEKDTVVTCYKCY